MTAPADWGRRNLWLLGLFGPVLILTGVGGLVLPPGSSPMSAAVPYDVFHVVFGALGVAIVLARSARFAGVFNVGFGAVDLYQALAGVLGIFPAGVFGLRPADHVVHVVLGAVLVGVGLRAPLAPRRPTPSVETAATR
jgi:hypothetical protein